MVKPDIDTLFNSNFYCKENQRKGLSLFSLDQWPENYALRPVLSPLPFSRLCVVSKQGFAA